MIKEFIKTKMELIAARKESMLKKFDRPDEKEEFKQKMLENIRNAQASQEKFGDANEFGEEEEEEDAAKVHTKLLSGMQIQRADYFAQTFFVWFCQIALCVIMTVEIIKGAADSIALYPSTYCVIISRFVCSIVLHMQ